MVTARWRIILTGFKMSTMKENLVRQEEVRAQHFESDSKYHNMTKFHVESIYRGRSMPLGHHTKFNSRYKYHGLLSNREQN